MTEKQKQSLVSLVKLYQEAPDNETKAKQLAELEDALTAPMAEPKDALTADNFPDLSDVDPSASDLKAKLRAALGIEPQTLSQPLNTIAGDMPTALLTAKGMGGAVLSEGTVCLLAGAGGAAKSALALHIALGMAMGNPEQAAMDGNVFDGVGGNVLFASYEDAPTVLAWRGATLARMRDAGTRGKATAAMPRVHVLNMRRLPLFGPDPKQGASYNLRPVPLHGWRTLWDEARRTKARLVIVDPALAAYVGNSNDAAPVREFLDALTDEAHGLGCGVLLVAHSNKTARQGKTDPFDPGQVGGSGHWVDGVRGVLTLTSENGRRRLSIAKANYGPAFVGLDLEPVRHKSGATVGFLADGDWEYGKGEGDEGEEGKDTARERRKKGELYGKYGYPV